MKYQVQGVVRIVTVLFLACFSVSAHAQLTQKSYQGVINHSSWFLSFNPSQYTFNLSDSASGKLQYALNVNRKTSLTEYNGVWGKHLYSGYYSPNAAFARIYQANRSEFTGGFNVINGQHFAYGLTDNFYLSGSGNKSSFSGNLQDFKRGTIRSAFNYSNQGDITQFKGNFDADSIIFNKNKDTSTLLTSIDANMLSATVNAHGGSLNWNNQTRGHYNKDGNNYNVGFNHGDESYGYSNIGKQYSLLFPVNEFRWALSLSPSQYSFNSADTKTGFVQSSLSFSQQKGLTNVNGGLSGHAFSGIYKSSPLSGTSINILDSKDTKSWFVLNSTTQNNLTNFNGQVRDHSYFGYINPNASFLRIYQNNKNDFIGSINSIQGQYTYFGQTDNYYLSGRGDRHAFVSSLYDYKNARTLAQISYNKQGSNHSLRFDYDNDYLSLSGKDRKYSLLGRFQGDFFKGSIDQKSILFDVNPSWSGSKDYIHIFKNPNQTTGDLKFGTQAISFTNDKKAFFGSYNSDNIDDTGLIYYQHKARRGALSLTMNDSVYSFTKTGNNYRGTILNRGSLQNKMTLEAVLNNNDGRLSILTNDFNASLDYQRINGLLNLKGQADGNVIHYSETNVSNSFLRQLELTKKNGDKITLDNSDINAIMKGRINHILDIVEFDFKSDLDFNLRFGTDNYFKFDTHARTFSTSIDGNSGKLKLGKSGYLQFDDANNKMHLKVSSPYKSTLYLERANFRNDSFALNLDSTTLKYDDKTRIAGLYTSRNYLVKVQTGGTDQISDDVKQVFDLAKSGDLDKTHRDQMIRDNIKEIQVNFREAARSDRLHFTDSRWNGLLTSLAWDVGDAKFTSDDVIAVIDAKDSKEQAYTVLSSALKQNPSKALLSKEKSLLFQMGQSINSQVPTATSDVFRTAPKIKPLGIKGLNSSTGVNFTQFNESTSSINGRVAFGADQGEVDINVPLVGHSSRTSLGLTTYAQRFYASISDNVIENNDVTFGLNSLFYLYRFPQPLTLSIRDSYHQGLSLNNVNHSAFDFEVNPAHQFVGTPIPGMMLGANLKSPEDKWYTSINVMPYLPLNLDNQLGVHPGGLAYATDMHAGVKGQFFNQDIQFDIGKDVNDYLTFAPTMTFKEALSLGLETYSLDASHTEIVKYKTGLKTGRVETNLFLEQNLFNHTDSLGTSIDAKLGANTYNVSFGVSQWDNNGQREIVEKYLSFGTDLNSRTRLVNSITLNDINRSVNYTTSSQFNLDKEGTKKLAMETSILQDAYQVGYDVRLKGQFLF